jgi:putative ABC transport system permease protein
MAASDFMPTSSRVSIMLKSLGLDARRYGRISGASPIYASIYQFIIVTMISAASGIAGLVVTLLFVRTFSQRPHN